MRLLVALVLVTSPLAAQTSAPSDAEVKVLGARITQWVMTGRIDSALAHMSPKLVEGFGGRDAMASASEELQADFGREKEVLMESVTRYQGAAEYWRMVLFTEYDEEPFVWHWVFDDDGLAIGLGLTNLGSTPPALPTPVTP
jgi:hypothetical protein